MAEGVQNVKEFCVLSLAIPAPPSLQSNGPIIHHLYIRSHSPKIPDPDTSRSLFITNIPIDTTLAHFRFLFSDQLDAGRVERVEFNPHSTAVIDNSGLDHSGHADAQSTPRGKKRKRGSKQAEKKPSTDLPDTWDRYLHKSGSNAVVVFVDRISMERALKCVKKAARAAKTIDWLSTSVVDSLPALGSSRYRAHHNLQYPEASKLQSAVDNFMADFAAREAAVAAERTRQRAMPDADGFITVTRGGRIGPGRAEEAQEKLEKLKEKEEKKRKEMEASGFYRFQAREAKKREAQELVDRFEKDRRRMQEMARRKKRRRPD